MIILFGQKLVGGGKSRTFVAEKLLFILYCAHLIVPFAPRKVLSLDNKNEKKLLFILYCAHLIVPFAPRKVLSLDNKNEKKLLFILYCAHLIVPLQPISNPSA